MAKRYYISIANQTAGLEVQANSPKEALKKAFPNYEFYKSDDSVRTDVEVFCLDVPPQHRILNEYRCKGILNVNRSVEPKYMLLAETKSNKELLLLDLTSKGKTNFKETLILQLKKVSRSDALSLRHQGLVAPYDRNIFKQSVLGLIALWRKRGYENITVEEGIQPLQIDNVVYNMYCIYTTFSDFIEYSHGYRVPNGTARYKFFENGFIFKNDKRSNLCTQ